MFSISSDFCGRVFVCFYTRRTNFSAATNGNALGIWISHSFSRLFSHRIAFSLRRFCLFPFHERSNDGNVYCTLRQHTKKRTVFNAQALHIIYKFSVIRTMTNAELRRRERNPKPSEAQPKKAFIWKHHKLFSFFFAGIFFAATRKSANRIIYCCVFAMVVEMLMRTRTNTHTNLHNHVRFEAFVKHQFRDASLSPSFICTVAGVFTTAAAAAATEQLWHWPGAHRNISNVVLIFNGPCKNEMRSRSAASFDLRAGRWKGWKNW